MKLADAADDRLAAAPAPPDDHVLAHCPLLKHVLPAIVFVFVVAFVSAIASLIPG